MRFTVLIVDDSRVARRMLLEDLRQSCPDWVLLEAASGREALDLASHVSINLLLMDMSLPDSSAMDASCQIAMQQAGCIVVLLSSIAQAAVSRQAAAQGFHFMAKPTPPDIARRCMALMEACHD